MGGDIKTEQQLKTVVENLSRFIVDAYEPSSQVKTVSSLRDVFRRNQNIVGMKTGARKLFKWEKRDQRSKAK